VSKTFPHVRLLLLIALVALLAAGCRESAREPDPETAADIDMQMTVDPQPATVGETELVLTLTSSDGEPVQPRQIEVRGDMNHAGMVPVLRTLENPDSDAGEFRVPFEWTMGGEWIVTVTVTLADDRVAVDEFELNVGSRSTSSLNMDEMVLADIEDCDDEPEPEDDGGCGALPPPDDNGLFQPVRP